MNCHRRGERTRGGVGALLLTWRGGGWLWPWPHVGKLRCEGTSGTGMRVRRRRGWTGVAGSSGSTGSSSSYLTERSDERLWTRMVAMESSRMRRIGSVRWGQEVGRGEKLRGSWVQWARHMGHVTLPWRTFEEIQMKWKACEHWAVNMAWQELAPSPLMRGSRHIAQRFCRMDGRKRVSRRTKKEQPMDMETEEEN